MLKRLWMLTRWPLAIVIVVGTMVLVTYEEHNARSKYQSDCKSHLPATAWRFYQDENSGNECDDPKKYMPWWDVLIAWPDGIAAWGLLATLTAIIWQSWETRKSAQSAEKQIALQSVAMSQWVNIEPIKTVTPPAFQNPIEVVLEFQVLNKTDYLLTVKKIEAEVFYGGKARIFKVSGSDPVPPEKSSAEGGLPFFLTLFANRSTWSDIGAMFFVGGKVTYLDCMNIERTQEFRDMFQGYEDGRLVRKKSSGQVPEITDYKAEDEEAKTSDSERSWFSWVTKKLKRAPKPN